MASQDSKCGVCGESLDGAVGETVCGACGNYRPLSGACTTCGEPEGQHGAGPAGERERTLREIELEQAGTVLQPLVSYLQVSYRKGEFQAVREAAAGIVVTLDRAGVRPEREELEPVVVRDRIVGLSRRLAQKEEVIAQLAMEIADLKREKSEIEKAQTARELFELPGRADGAALETVIRIRAALLAMQRNLTGADEESARRTLRAVEALLKRVDEFLVT